MPTIATLLRSLAALLALFGTCAAQDPDIQGTATFPAVTYACEFANAATGATFGTGTVQPDPAGDPPGVPLTVRWDKVVIEGVEWIAISRDEQLLGRVCPSTGQAWINVGGGVGGTWE